MVDAETFWQAWLLKHRAPRFVADRGRGVALPEPMTAGDVFDDGSVLTMSGIVVSRAVQIWMDYRKMAAASYYGWRRTPGLEMTTNPQNGEMLYLMTR